MKSLVRIRHWLFLVGVVEVAALAQTPTPALNPANGNCYLIVEERKDWFAARDTAQSLIFDGVDGHLATFTSLEENQWVLDNLLSDFNFITRTGLWIGGFQDPLGSEPAGGWQWITGEPWVFTNWAEGAPNNWGDEEPCLRIRWILGRFCRHRLAASLYRRI